MLCSELILVLLRPKAYYMSMKWIVASVSEGAGEQVKSPRQTLRQLRVPCPRYGSLVGYDSVAGQLQ